MFNIFTFMISRVSGHIYLGNTKGVDEKVVTSLLLKADTDNSMQTIHTCYTF